jgi:hypothetical protein
MVQPGDVVITFGVLTAVVVSIRTIASAALRSQENKLKFSQPAQTSAAEARLERMEQALDAIAIEVERISEGQRFTTKLLSERTTTVD